MSGVAELRSASNRVEFETVGGGLTLTSAILLYGPEGAGRPMTGAAFASLHGIEEHDGKPVIAAGTPLTRAHVRKWASLLGRAAAPEILPENVLVSHPDMLAWWIPERVRTAHFAISHPTADLKVLGQRTTVAVPYPAHLLIATRRSLGVYALAVNKRPTAETVAYHSPVLNVFINGSLCWGNIAKPKTLGISSMAQFEAAVFDSWSTHPNAGQDQAITGKGGLVRLWDDLAVRKARTFPVRRLKPFLTTTRGKTKGQPLTVGQLIAGGA